MYFNVLWHHFDEFSLVLTLFDILACSKIQERAFLNKQKICRPPARPTARPPARPSGRIPAGFRPDSGRFPADFRPEPGRNPVLFFGGIKYRTVGGVLITGPLGGKQIPYMKSGKLPERLCFPSQKPKADQKWDLTILNGW